MSVSNLVQYLEASARTAGDRVAVVEPGGRSLTYRELDRQADALAAHLEGAGVVRGDRVGVVLPKTIEAVVSLFGIMKAGAAYVPVDYTAPSVRARTILQDCRISALIVDEQHDLAHEPLDAARDIPTLLTGEPLCVVLAGAGQPTRRERSIDDLAYILYTSGSTGVPKGVTLTHRNAISFVEWCSSVFHPTAEDRFSSHAPFHFDLSILDLYVSLKHGAALHLIPDGLGRSPKDLARFIAERRLTVWYSTPSILTLLLQYGGLDRYDLSHLRLVLFAGEEFPVKHLRQITRHWASATFYNLYGPTETNVCTYARIPSVVPDTRERPYPIGAACEHYRAMVVGDDGMPVAEGAEGMLYVAGPSVFPGYWNRPERTAASFLERDGLRWYNTGDVVRADPAEGLIYVGRRDRMVKRRGYRIELGEIERALYQHRDVREAAVVSVADPDAGTKIVAFLACRGDAAPSLVELKTFCGSRIPAYMSPDRFVFQDPLPKTSTDKIDYQRLTRQAC